MGSEWRDINKKLLGSKVQYLRERRGLSREKVAELLSLSDKTVANIEKGVYGTDTNHLFHMAQLYNSRIDWLLEPTIDLQHFICLSEGAAAGEDDKPFASLPLPCMRPSLFVGEGEETRQEIAYEKKMLADRMERMMADLDLPALRFLLQMAEGLRRLFPGEE